MWRESGAPARCRPLVGKHRVGRAAVAGECDARNTVASACCAPVLCERASPATPPAPGPYSGCAGRLFGERESLGATRKRSRVGGPVRRKVVQLGSSHARAELASSTEWPVCRGECSIQRTADPYHRACVVRIAAAVPMADRGRRAWRGRARDRRASCLIAAGPRSGAFAHGRQHPPIDRCLRCTAVDAKVSPRTRCSSACARSAACPRRNPQREQEFSRPQRTASFVPAERLAGAGANSRSTASPASCPRASLMR